MDNILQTTFSDKFSSMKMFEFWLGFRWSLFLRVQLAYTIIGSGNGLVPSGWPAIIWTNDD